MRPRLQLSVLAAVVVTAFMTSGCASTKVTKREILYIGSLPRPAHIWVYNFVATPSDLPANSLLVGESEVDDTPQTDEQIAMGRQLGSEISSQLATEIRAMGLPGIQAASSAAPQINDLIIRGYLLSIKPGSAAKRVLIGFGSGGSELRTMVEGFQVTPEGLRRLGGGTLDSGGNKTPGAALGLAAFLATANPVGLIVSSGMKVYGETSGKSKVQGRAKATAQEIAKLLKVRFQEQG